MAVENKSFHSDIGRYGFDTEVKDIPIMSSLTLFFQIEQGTPVFLHEGKKLICVRTLDADKTEKIMKEYFEQDPDLKKYYDWHLFVESKESSDDEKATKMQPSEVQDNLHHMHNELGYDSALIEAGPYTMFE